MTEGILSMMLGLFTFIFYTFLTTVISIIEALLLFFFAPQGVASKKAMPILGGGLYFNG